METRTIKLCRRPGGQQFEVEGTVHELPGYDVLVHVHKTRRYWAVFDYRTGLRLYLGRRKRGSSPEKMIELAVQALVKRRITPEMYKKRRDTFPTINNDDDADINEHVLY